ncbi:histidine utilization repressor [Rheinheimera sp. MMS21-TC3]|uniref:histidine utilization repressor n=1 Tax=unclassified Rheinheimera TaxID=115860 RepID=UPI0028C43A5E|nr:histidine utilization repressor [Rheinheimera sp. MMS21-TC3]WNO60465.1 histidine utilization repressor [Rheinheimera sp. MMS21-TC3]
MAVAKYAEIKEYMLGQIEIGAWPEHSRVPSENDLAGQFSVSRMTARRALQELTEQGILYRTQGVGSFVAALKSQSSLLEIRNIADEINARGHSYQAKLVQLTELPCPAVIAEALGLKRNQPVYFSLIVHIENQLPLQLEARYVSPLLVPDYVQQDFNSQTPHQYLSFIAPLTEAEHTVEAIWPDHFTCQQLQLKKAEPCLRLTRRTFSREGAVSLAYLTSPGSRYRLGGHLNFSLPTSRENI